MDGTLWELKRANICALVSYLVKVVMWITRQKIISGFYTQRYWIHFAPLPPPTSSDGVIVKLQQRPQIEMACQITPRAVDFSTKKITPIYACC